MRTNFGRDWAWGPGEEVLIRDQFQVGAGGRILPATQGQGHHQQALSALLLSDSLSFVWETLQRLTWNLVDLRAGLSWGDLPTGLIPNRDPFRGIHENLCGFPASILSTGDPFH